MRRLLFLSLVSCSLLPALALAQTTPPVADGQAQTAPPPPGPPPPGFPPPPGGPGGTGGPGGPGGHHHGPGMMMQKFQARFNAANTTHDGHLTLAQAQAAGLRPVVDHFSQIDSSHHGYVTLNEVEAWHLDDMAKHLEKRAASLRAADKG